MEVSKEIFEYLITLKDLLELLSAPGRAFILEFGFHGLHPQVLMLILAHLPHMINRLDSELYQSVGDGWMRSAVIRIDYESESVAPTTNCPLTLTLRAGSWQP